MVLIRRTGGRWESPTMNSYGNEDELEALLEESPGLILG